MERNQIFQNAVMQVIQGRLQFNKEHYGEKNKVTEITELKPIGVETFDITGTTFFTFIVKTDYIQTSDKKIGEATWRVTIDQDGIFGLKLLEVID